MEYELILMLDPETPEERRVEIANEARQRIESGGSLKNDTAWGMRKLAYEIRQRTEADYRFFRFETGGELLDDLSHDLRIAEGILLPAVNPASLWLTKWNRLVNAAAPSAVSDFGRRRAQRRKRAMGAK